MIAYAQGSPWSGQIAGQGDAWRAVHGHHGVQQGLQLKELITDKTAAGAYD